MFEITLCYIFIIIIFNLLSWIFFFVMSNLTLHFETFEMELPPFSLRLMCTILCSFEVALNRAWEEKIWSLNGRNPTLSFV